MLHNDCGACSYVALHDLDLHSSQLELMLVSI